MIQPTAPWYAGVDIRRRAALQQGRRLHRPDRGGRHRAERRGDPGLVEPGRLRRAGELIANLFTADSGGTGKALVQAVPAFAVLKAYGDSVKSTIKKICTWCEVTSLDIAPAKLARTGGRLPAASSSMACSGTTMPVLPPDPTSVAFKGDSAGRARGHAALPRASTGDGPAAWRCRAQRSGGRSPSGCRRPSRSPGAGPRLGSRRRAAALALEGQARRVELGRHRPGTELLCPGRGKQAR